MKKKKRHLNDLRARCLWAPWLLCAGRAEPSWSIGGVSWVCPSSCSARSRLLRDILLSAGVSLLLEIKKKEYKLFCYGFIPECEQNFSAIILPKSFFVMGSGCHSNRLLKISKKFSAHGKPISQTVSMWIGKSGGQLFIHTQFNWGLT